MTSFGNNPEDSPRRRNADYRLEGATPVLQWARDFNHSATTAAILKAELSQFISEIDSAFEAISNRSDGVFIAITYHLWLPSWHRGRLAGFHAGESLEGRSKSSESLEDDAWQEALLWPEEDRASNRQRVLSDLRDALYRIIEEGIDYFEQITSSRSNGQGDEISLLVGPASEDNLAALLFGDEHGMLKLTGQAGEKQNVKADLSIVLYNDVFRRDMTVVSFEDLRNNPDIGSDDD